MRVEESIEINRPLKAVFDYVSDVLNYPEWMAHALAGREVHPGHQICWPPLRNSLPEDLL